MIASDLRNQNLNPIDPDNLASPSALLDFEAPYFELADLDGKIVSVADYRGQILFLNFWQSTCPPCLRELPDFVAFMEEQNSDEVTWLAINVAETPEIIRTFFAAHDFVGIPVVMDRDASVSESYGIIGYPITYGLDAKGVIRHMSIGEINYAEMKAILEAIQTGA
jgi:peroxiredoxin